MAFPGIKAFVLPVFTLLLILGISTGLIAYGRGYRLDLRQNSFKSTGLIAATSDPIGAQVLIDNVLKTATNNSFNLDPGWYTVQISKEGYISWEKKLRLQMEIVTRADAFLFPTNPSLSPLTVTGIDRPVLSPDGTKIAYVIPATPAIEANTKKAGLWVYELVDRTLGRNRDQRLIGASDTVFDFTKVQMLWSPDSRQILATNGRDVRLYDLERPENILSVTSTYKQLLEQWYEDRVEKDRSRLAAFKPPVIELVTAKARILAFSPDETKILYEATSAASLPLVVDPPLIGTNSTADERTIEPGKLYVYDAAEDKNYFVLDKKELPEPKNLPTPTPTPRSSKQTRTQPNNITIDQYNNTVPLLWFPTSRHLVLTLPGKIDVMEYDRTNWITVYSGPFVDGFIAPWPNGSRIIILTNFNPDAGTLPNLYTVNLR